MNECEHEWKWHDEEYGSLADGGSYDVYKCAKCGSLSYSAMGD